MEEFGYLTAPEPVKANAGLASFLKDFSPYHMGRVKHYFGLLKDSVNIGQFAAIMALAVREVSEKMASEVAQAMFELIDLRQRGVIGLSQFTSFLVEAEQMVNRDQNLSDIRLLRVEGLTRHSAEQLYPCPGAPFLACLAADHKSVSGLDPASKK
jgi:hypothetical protein